MTRALRLFALAIALSACGARAPAPAPSPPRGDFPPMPQGATSNPAALGVIRLSGTPARALVFLNGRFAGDLAPDAELEITRPAGVAQLRISEAAHFDYVSEITFEAEIQKSLQVVLGRVPEAWRPPSAPIQLQVGQPVRGLLVPKEGDTEASVLYTMEEIHFPHRLIALLEGAPTFRVQAPDGSDVPVTRFDGQIHGCPGSALFTYAAAKTGLYQLEVRGKAGPFSFRFVQDPPPPAVTENASLKRRRGPPVPPRR